jgi:hypothetical protein
MLGAINYTTNNDSITAEIYNTVQNQVYQVLGPTCYDYSAVLSSQLTAGTVISSTHLLNLYLDVKKLIIHQTNEDLVKLNVLRPSSSMVFTASWLNNLIQYVNNSYNNRFTANSQQLIEDLTNSVSARTSKWNADMKHVVKYTWETASNANAYFNLGGYFFVQLSTSDVFSQLDSLRWERLINIAEEKLLLDSARYYRSDWATINIGGVKSVMLASEGTDSVTLNYTKVSSTILTVSIEFKTIAENYEEGNDYITFDILSKVVAHRSVGDFTENTGVANPVYKVETIQFLEDYGYNAFVPDPKISVTPNPFIVSGYTTSTSETKVLTVKNIGNTTTTITGIQNSIVGGNLQLVNNNDFPFTFEPNQTKDISVYFNDTDYPGEYNGKITFTGKLRAGPYKLPATLNLQLIPFGFTLSPATQTKTFNQLASSYPSDQINIIVNNKYLYYTEYSAKFVDSNGANITPIGFSLSTTSILGPVIYFDPLKLPQGTYDVFVSVTVKELTQTAKVTIIHAVPIDMNLGTWLSSLGEYNAVVGMSYDIMQGQRYLTIGIGVNANGGPKLKDDPTGSKIEIGALTLTGDSGFTPTLEPKYQGIVYRGPTISNWSGLLNSDGIWVDNAGSIFPVDTFVNRKYKFYVSDGSSLVKWTASIDNTLDFYIDGAKVASLGDESWGRTSSGSLTLSQGFHEIAFSIRNIDNGGNDTNINPGCGAIVLSNATTGNQYWSTKDVARDASTGYRFWQEVYRIPIPNGSGTMYMDDVYRVKDAGAAFNSSGRAKNRSLICSYYNNNSLFSISYDASGNLTIKQQLRVVPKAGDYETSLLNLDQILYYYSESYTRYKQLQTPYSDKTTDLFTGFTSAGAVTTTRVPYPTRKYITYDFRLYPSLYKWYAGQGTYYSNNWRGYWNTSLDAGYYSSGKYVWEYGRNYPSPAQFTNRSEAVYGLYTYTYYRNNTDAIVLQMIGFGSEPDKEVLSKLIISKPVYQYNSYAYNYYIDQQEIVLTGAEATKFTTTYYGSQYNREITAHYYISRLQDNYLVSNIGGADIPIKWFATWEWSNKSAFNFSSRYNDNLSIYHTSYLYWPISISLRA